MSIFLERIFVLGEAGNYVKEIINITTEDRKHKKDKEADRHLTEEEKQEQDQRREKLLEAGEFFVSIISVTFLLQFIGCCGLTLPGLKVVKIWDFIKCCF